MKEDTTVVVLRQKDGPDVVGIYVTGKFRDDGVASHILEHPYVPYIDEMTGMLTLIPYCVLSDQTLYEFQIKDLLFMVPAKDELAEEYMEGIARKNVSSILDSQERKIQQAAFKKAMTEYVLSPSTETVQ